MNIDLATLTIERAHDAFARGDFTPRDLVAAYLERIKEKNAEWNVYREVFEDVLLLADAAGKRFADGTATMLTGIPIAIKDNILYKNHAAGASSKILEGYVATYTSSALQRLLDAGGIVLGRTNMDEFAMGSSTENSAYGVTHNPLDPSRVPGGSSGGSSAAVAGHLALAALGTDTGGSIRQPAAFTGTVGMYPTYGTISRSGIIALASSLDQIGPITRTVRDAEILIECMAGFDPLDATSLPESLRSQSHAPAKKRLGIPRAFLDTDGLAPTVRDNFLKAVEALTGAGYEIVDVTLPLATLSLAVYYIIQPAEASSNLGRYDGLRYGNQKLGADLLETYERTRGEGFGPETRRRIMLGTYVLSHGYYDAYYNKAVKMRDAIKKEFAEVFQTVDAIITPTTPSAAFKIGEKSDPLSMYLSDIFTVPANIAQIPAISVPSGVDENGLPLGLHIMGPELREDIVFAIANDFEKLK